MWNPGYPGSPPGNPVPEAKWVLRGRIVTNNTSPLHGAANQQYVIQEEGEPSVLVCNSTITRQ